MPNSSIILNSYSAVWSLIAKLLGVEACEGESEYYPFSSEDASKGFLEIVYPVADNSGRLLRGAAGNGEIFIFLYCHGSWTFLGEMHGAKATAIVTSTTTDFKVYAHSSASTGIERHYQLQGEKYVCVSESDITAD